MGKQKEVRTRREYNYDSFKNYFGDTEEQPEQQPSGIVDDPNDGVVRHNAIVPQFQSPISMLNKLKQQDSLETATDSVETTDEPLVTEAPKGQVIREQPLSTEPYKPVQGIDAFSSTGNQQVPKSGTIKTPDPNVLNQGLEKVAPGFVERKRQRDELSNKLLQGIQQGRETVEPLSGQKLGDLKLQNAPMGEFRNAVDLVANSGLKMIPGTIEALGLIADKIFQRGLAPQVNMGDFQTPEKIVSGITGEVGKEIRKGIDTFAPVDPKIKGFFTSTLPAAVGSGLGFLAGGFIGKAVKIPTIVNTLLLSTSQAAEEYNSALEQTGDYTKAYNTFLGNLPFAATEVVPFEHLFSKLDKLGGRRGTQLLIDMLVQGTVEGSQEVIQQFGTNLNAKAIYDASRSLSEGTLEGGAAGFITGMLMSGIGNVASQKLSEGNLDPKEIEQLSDAIKNINLSKAKVEMVLKDFAKEGLVDESLNKATLGNQDIDQIVLNELNPNVEQALSTTQETRRDVREIPGGTIPIQPSETQPVKGLTQEENLIDRRLVQGQVENEQPTVSPINLNKMLQSQIIEQKTDANKQKQEEQKKIEEQKQNQLKIREQKQDKAGRDAFAEINRQFQNAKRNGKLFDDKEVANLNDKIESPKWKARLEELYTQTLENNKKLRAQFETQKKADKEKLSLRLFERPIDKLTAQQKDILDNYKAETIPLETVKPKIKEIKQEPTLKDDNTTQLEIMQKAGIPEEDILDYALSSVADGKILRSYLDEVKAGDISIDEAAERVKKDYAKMKSGEKEGKFIEPEIPKVEEVSTSGQEETKVLKEKTGETNVSPVSDTKGKGEAKSFSKTSKETDDVSKEIPQNVGIETKNASNLEKKSDVLEKKVTGSMFVGRTWKQFIDEVPNYFLPKFKKPLRLENQSDVLSENIRKNYGDTDIKEFLEDLAKYPNASISVTTTDKGKNYVTRLPKETIEYLKEKLPNYLVTTNNYLETTSTPTPKVESAEQPKVEQPSSEKPQTDNNKASALRMFGEGKKDTDVVTALGLTGKAGMDQVREWRQEYDKKFVKDHIIVAGIKPVEPKADFETKVQQIIDKGLVRKDTKADLLFNISTAHKEYSVDELKEAHKRLQAKTEQPESASGFVKVPIKDLTTSLKDFQGRGEEYSKQTFDRIINEVKEGTFNESAMPPIQIWKDPRTNSWTILAGHSRTAAYNELSKTDNKFSSINAQVVEAKTLEEAKKIAQESNAGAKQTNVENAVYFRNLKENIKTKKEIQQKAQDLYGSDWVYTYNIAHLNPEGEAFQLLKAFQKSTDKASQKKIETIGDFIGAARAKYPELTDAHEDELFDYLYDGSGQKITNKNDFLDRLDNITSAFDYNFNKPLNIDSRVTKGYNQANIENEIKDIRAQIKELEKERDKGTLSENRLNKISEEIGLLNKDLVKLFEQRFGAKEADRNQTDLFANLDAPELKEELNEQESSDIEAIASQAEAIASEKEEASEKEIDDAVENIDNQIDLLGLKNRYTYKKDKTGYIVLKDDIPVLSTSIEDEGYVKWYAERSNEGKPPTEQEIMQERKKYLKPPTREVIEVPKSKSGYKVGDRVILPNGRHGEIIKDESYSTRSFMMFSNEPEKIEHHENWKIKSDNGREYTERPEQLKHETEPNLENVVEDIKYEDTYFEPDHFKSLTDYYLGKYKNMVAASQRARKPENKNAYMKTANGLLEDYNKRKELFNNWVDKNPGEAERLKLTKIGEKTTQPVNAPIKTSSSTGGRVNITENDRGGIDVKFDAKPSSDIISKLKSNGFRWTNTGGGHWWAKRTDYKLKIANEIKQEIEGKAEEPKAETPALQKPATLKNNESVLGFLKSQGKDLFLDKTDDLAELIANNYRREDLPPTSMLFPEDKAGKIDKMLQVSIKTLSKDLKPYEMSLEAYATREFLREASVESGLMSQALYIPIKDYKKSHLKSVQEALDNGIKVDPRALADHPELTDKKSTIQSIKSSGLQQAEKPTLEDVKEKLFFTMGEVKDIKDIITNNSKANALIVLKDRIGSYIGDIIVDNEEWVKDYGDLYDTLLGQKEELASELYDIVKNRITAQALQSGRGGLIPTIPKDTTPKTDVIDKDLEKDFDEFFDALDDVNFSMKPGVPKAIEKRGKELYSLKPGQRIPDKIQLMANSIVGKLVEKDVYKFADMVKLIETKFGRDKLEQSFDAMKAGYSAFLAVADDATMGKMDEFSTVRNYQLPAKQSDVKSIQDLMSGKTSPKEFVAKTNDQKLADAIYNRLEVGQGVRDNRDLNDMSDIVYGGTKAQGRYQSQDSYNALEAAVNRWVINKGIYDMPVEQALEEMRTLLKMLPTQTNRNADKDLLQQFSTPPTLSYFAAKLLNPNGKDVILEPSAGTGSLISFIRDKVAKVYANEIDPKRKALLEYLGFETSEVDAEFLNSLLPQEIKPTKIIMNPPFSATGGRVKQNSNKFGYKHLQTALARLEDGGRLVAILGEGAEFGRPEANKMFWDKVVEKYNVRADVGIENNDYGKYGTTFGNRIIVIDKTGPTPNKRPELQGSYKTIEEALDAANNIISTTPTALANGAKDVSLGTGTQPSGISGTSGRAGNAGRGEPGSKPISSDIAESQSGEGNQGISSGQGIRPSATKQPIQPTGPKTQQQRIEPEGTKAGNGSDTGSNPDVGTIDYEEGDLASRETEQSGFVEYKPKQKVTGSQTHPAKLVETASMAAVDIPNITYKPNLPESSIKEGKISDAQLETIALIGQRHQLVFPNGSRAGFFVGDGTGVGKGRIIAGSILDNWNQGRKKILWVSVSTDLMKDAKRDLKGVGADHIPIQLVNDFKLGEDMPSEVKGVVFSTYTSFAYEKDNNKRAETLAKWLGDDGIIVFDEAHKAKNILASGRGGKPTKTAQAVVDIQETYLPKARVIYASATGATNVKHMGYMTRLGLWGQGMAFPNFGGFMSEVESGGIGAMEMVARDLKALGMYSSRSISFDGIEYTETEHILTPDQRRMYDTAAEAWQVVMQNIDDAIELTGGGTNAKRWAYTAFWGAHQRFFKQFITALKVPTLLKATDKHLADGKSVVISMIGTHEASTTRKVNEKLAEGESLDDLDLSPREVLAQMVENSFPVTEYEQYTDDQGNIKSRPLIRDGVPVENPEAVAMRERLLNRLGDIHLPENPLDQIINYYELKAKNENDRTLRVAELTGRKKRLVKEITKNPDENAKEKYVFGTKIRYDKRVPKDVRSKDTNIYEMEQFQSGQKKIAVITQAASTGISLHADKDVKGTNRRVQIAAELSWSADTQMQTFGRTHRSNQEVPPIYDLLSSDVGGEKRFASTIAKRLASLGALTKGERGATGGGQLAKYDFENEYGEAALSNVYNDMLQNRPIPGIDGSSYQVLEQMGVLKGEPPNKTIPDEDMTRVTLFLNRVLGLQIDTQNALFNHYATQFEDVVVRAKESGSYDEGVADVKGNSIKIAKAPETVYTDALTGAETKHYQLDVVKPTNPMSFNTAQTYQRNKDGRAFYHQKKSGNVVLKLDANAKTDALTGKLKMTVVTVNPHGNKVYMPEEEFNDKYERILPSDAEPIWDEKFETVPKEKTEEMHVISGAILPLWRKLRTSGGDKIKVVRAMTDDKQRIVGVQIPNNDVGTILKSLNVKRDLRTPQEIFDAVLYQGDQINLSGELALKRVRLSGDNAIELVGTGPLGLDSNRFDEFKNLGLTFERINFKPRFFIPTDPDVGVDILVDLLDNYPAVEGNTPDAENIRPISKDKDDFGNEVPKLFEKQHDFRVKNPYFSDVKVELAKKNFISYRTEEEIRASDYPFYPEEWESSKLRKGDPGYEEGKTKYIVSSGGGYWFEHPSGGSRIRASEEDGPAPYTEELIHHLQRRVEQENPKLDAKIKQWEWLAKKHAFELGLEVPQGYETFAKAYVFNHLEFAGNHPTEVAFAELVQIPDDILKEFEKEFINVGENKEFVDFVSQLKGNAPIKQIRLPQGRVPLTEGKPYKENNPDKLYLNQRPGEPNQIDFGVGLGQVVTNVADKIQAARMTKEFERVNGIESNPKLKKWYREFLTAPQWFFDKEPQLQKIWDIVDKNFVRNVNEESALLKEELWKNGKEWRGLSDTAKTAFLNKLEKYEKDLYEAQNNSSKMPYVTFKQFADQFSDPKIKDFINNTYRKTIQQALDFVKDVDRYILINRTPNNPFLEDFNNYRGKDKKELAKLFEKAKNDFFKIDPNAEALFENELLKQGKQINEIQALNSAWAENRKLREDIAETMIIDKYKEMEDKMYFPSSRLGKKYFLSATKKSNAPALFNMPNESFFTTDDRPQYLERVKDDLISQGYDVKIGKFADAQKELLDNTISQEDILDLAILTGIETDNKVLDRLLKSVLAKGFSKHFIPKRYVPGFQYTQENFDTAISKYVGSVPYFKNRTIGGYELDDHLAYLKEKGILKPGSNNEKYIQDLRNKLESRDETIAQGLRAAASVWYLSLRPSYIAQQLVQPINTLMPLLPIVAKELGLKQIEAEKAFAESFLSSVTYYSWKIADKAQRMKTGKGLASDFGLGKEFIDTIQRLEKQGVGKPLRSLEIIGEQVDPTKFYNPNPAVTGVSTLAKIIGIPGILVEDFTRAQGIRAFFNLGKKAGLKGDALVDFISKQIAKSYGPASGRLSKPPGYKVGGDNALSTGLRSIVESHLTFKNFAFMNFGQWGKTYRAIQQDHLLRPLLYKLGAQVGLGGLKYMMWVSTVLSLLSGLYGMLDIPEDPEEQYENLFKHLNKVVPGLGDAVYKGVASITFKVDLSALFSQQAPFISEDVAFKQNLGDALEGAPITLAKDIITGIKEGDAKKLLPSGVKNYVTADTYGDKGVNWGSRQLMKPEEVTDDMKLKKKLGFTPLEISDAYQEERTRSAKSKEIGDIVRSTVSDDIIPLIEAGRTYEARKKFIDLFEMVKKNGSMTEFQEEKIKNVDQFISRFVMGKLEIRSDEREKLSKWREKSNTNSKYGKNYESKYEGKYQGSY